VGFYLETGVRRKVTAFRREEQKQEKKVIQEENAKRSGTEIGVDEKKWAKQMEGESLVLLLMGREPTRWKGDVRAGKKMRSTQRFHAQKMIEKSTGYRRWLRETCKRKKRGV